MPIGAALIMGGANLLGGMMGADASRDAANTQAAASRYAADQQKAMFDIQNRQTAAGRGAGYQAFNLIRSMLPGTYTAYDEGGNAVGSGTQPITSGSQMMRGGGRQYIPDITIKPAFGPYGPRTVTSGDSRADAWVKSQAGEISRQRSASLGGATAGATDDEIRALYDQYYNGSDGGYQSGQPIGNVTASGDQTGSGYFTKQFNAEDFYNNLDPGYAFRLQQGQAANQAALNKGGGLIGGNVLTGMNDYNQGMASQEYGNAFNRFQTQRNNIYNTLASIAGLGQTSQQQANQATQNFANNQTALITGAGAAQAAGQIGAANAMSNALGGIGNAASFYQMMKRPSNPYVNTYGASSGYAPTSSSFGYDAAAGQV